MDLLEDGVTGRINIDHSQGRKLFGYLIPWLQFLGEISCLFVGAVGSSLDELLDFIHVPAKVIITM